MAESEEYVSDCGTPEVFPAYDDLREMIDQVRYALAQIEAYVDARPSDFKDVELACKARRDRDRLVSLCRSMVYRCNSYHKSVIEDDSAGAIYSCSQN